MTSLSPWKIDWMRRLMLVIATVASSTITSLGDESIELADVRSTVIANAETWRQFDLLMRSETFILESEAPLEDKVGSRTIFTRLGVDFDKEQCFCFMSGIGQSSDERFDRVGICNNGTTGYREFPGGASNLQSGITQLLHRMYVPDLRCLALCDYPASFQVDSSFDGFEYQRRMGPNGSPDNSKFKFKSTTMKDAVELTLEGKHVAFKYRFSPKTNMPLGIRSFRVATDPWTLEKQEDFQWQEKEGIFLPTEIGRDFPYSRKIDGKLVPFRKAEIVQIHWLSFNQPLDPKLFELSTVNDISKLRKLVDPVACGAERLK
jgi:hypothetical protein